MHSIHARVAGFILVASMLAIAVPLGKISYVEGDAFLVDHGKQKQLKVNQKVDLGDQIRTGEESVVEVTYDKGTVIRIGEKSDVKLSGGDLAGNVQVNQGKVWANVHKLASGQFRVTTPTATAAVRGTVFRVETEKDSSSTIALYDGKVDVGPADTTKLKPSQGSTNPTWGPPTEVPGPYEVSMETWIHLDPGKEINVRWGGKYAEHAIDTAQESQNTWVEFNRQRDQQVKR